MKLADALTIMSEGQPVLIEGSFALPSKFQTVLAAGEGIEPSSTGSEPVDLPLNYPTIGAPNQIRTDKLCCLKAATLPFAHGGLTFI